MEPLIIAGAGGFGRETLDVAEAQGFHDFLGFVDDTPPPVGLLERRGAAYLGAIETAQQADAGYVVGIGDPDTRYRVAELLDGWGLRAVTLVHPDASIGADVELGAGVVVTAGVRITTNVRIGRHSHLNLNSTVGHDTVIGEFVSIAPGALISGNVTIEDGVYIGTGASINQGLTVGSRAVVGAAAAVVRHVEGGTTVVGVPATALAP